MDAFTGTFLGLVVALVVVGIIGIATITNMKLNAPCDKFKNWSVTDVPARCLGDFKQ
jgi:hypothetical protein